MSCPIISSCHSPLPYLIPLARAKQAKVVEVEEHAPEQSKTQKLLVEHASLLNAFLKSGIQGPHMWPQALTCCLSAFKSVGKPGAFMFASPCSSTCFRCQGLKDSRDPSALTLYSSTVAFHSWFDQSLCSICRHPLSSPNNIENASCALYQSLGPKIFNIFHFQTLTSTSTPCATKSFLHPLGLRYRVAKC